MTVAADTGIGTSQTDGYTLIVRKIRYVGSFGFSDRWIHAHREENSLRGFASQTDGYTLIVGENRSWVRVTSHTGGHALVVRKNACR